MKRFLAFICALVLAFTSFPGTEVFAIGANADSAEEILAERAENGLFVDEMEEVDLFPDLCPDDSVPKTNKSSQENLFSDAFMDYLLVHFGNCEAEFKVEQFNIPYSQWENLKTIIWYETPELFHVKRLGCAYTGDDIIQTIRVGYRTHADTVDEYQTCLKKMRDGAKYLLQGVKGNKNLTDVEKALILHDRLAVWTEYDLGNVNSAGVDHKIFAAYSALGEGLSVCQGYAMAYMYLLEQVGIESDLCSSDHLWHAWNIVYIDGVAYHVDVTWDDPNNGSSATYYDDYGRVHHKNFLLSTAGIWASGHTASDYNTAPNDTRYDSKSAATWWRNSNTAIQLIGDKLYYQQLNGDVYNSDNGVLVHDHGYGSFCALSSANELLLCANEREVHAVDIKNNETSVVYTASGLGNIQGMKYEKGKLHIQLTDNYGNVWRESLDYLVPECTEYTYTVENGEATITGYNGVGGDVVVPSVLDGYPVAKIGEWAFAFHAAVTSVVIPEGVTAIGLSAFSNCNGLTTVKIPKSLTSIGSNSFYNCTNIRTIYYGGTTEESKDIYYYSGNDALKNATWICTDPHQHNYTREITSATCIEKGYTTYTCSCGDTYKANYINALGHSYKSGVCTRCKHKPTGAKITTQPVNVAVKSGKTATVSIKATGSGLKYTWYYAKKGAKTYTKASSTTNSYSLKMSSSYNGTKAYCVVTDQYGNSVKSNVVTLYKGTPVKITTQPKSATVANGKTGKLTIKASGSSLKYSWYIQYKGASSFTKVGSSSKTYSFKMASKLDGAEVYCVVKDKYGIEVKSSVVTLKMPVQPKITTQPASVKLFSGKTAKLTVKASGDGLKYQWYYAKKGSSKFKKLSAKSATYSLKMSSSMDGRKVYCLVTDKYGQTVKSSVVTLTMLKTAKITTQPKDVSVKNGKTATVTIKATGDGLKYTWYYLLPGTTTYQKAAVTNNAFSVTMSAKYKNAKVYCSVADQYGNVVKSKTVTLKMK